VALHEKDAEVKRLIWEGFYLKCTEPHCRLDWTTLDQKLRNVFNLSETLMFTEHRKASGKDSIRTLDMVVPAFVAAGESHLVHLQWRQDHEQRHVLFTVPAGRDVFGQSNPRSGAELIPVFVESSNEPLIPAHQTALFCHACKRNGTRYGDICWGLITVSSAEYVRCGCSGPGWRGHGVFVRGGGWRRDRRLFCPDGAFSGSSADGQAKSRKSSLKVSMSGIVRTVPFRASRKMFHARA
jgi:hypothetical protein